MLFWVRQNHLSYCPRQRMLCWLLGSCQLPSLKQLADNSRYAVEGLFGMGRKVQCSARWTHHWTRAPHYHHPHCWVVNSSAEAWKADWVPWCSCSIPSPADRHRLAEAGAGLSVLPSAGLQQDRWLSSGTAGFGGLKVCCKFCGFFPKGFS